MENPKKDSCHKTEQNISQEASEPCEKDTCAEQPLKSNEEVQENEIELLKNKLTESQDRFLRLAAEFDNFKKISKRELSSSLKFASESLVLSLLPILDSLDTALKTKSDNAHEVIKGVEMVAKQFEEVLARHGVKFFSAKGEKFDPACHEAISQIADDSVEENTILEEYQRGCYLHERLLRAARVVVSKKP